MTTQYHQYPGPQQFAGLKLEDHADHRNVGDERCVGCCAGGWFSIVIDSDHFGYIYDLLPWSNNDMENPGIGVNVIFPFIFKTHISQVTSLISKWPFDFDQDIPK